MPQVKKIPSPCLPPLSPLNWPPLQTHFAHKFRQLSLFSGPWRILVGRTTMKSCPPHRHVSEVAIIIANVLTGKPAVLDKNVEIILQCTGTSQRPTPPPFLLTFSSLACQVSAILSSFGSPLYFLTSYFGNKVLCEYMTASLGQITIMHPSVSPEALANTYSNFKVAYDLFKGPMGDSLTAYEKAIAPTNTESQNRNIRTSLYPQREMHPLPPPAQFPYRQENQM